MAALQYVDVPGYSALILRRTFPELEQPNNVIPMTHEWFGAVPESIRPRYSGDKHEWRFPSGAVIRFGHLDNPNAMIRYQGGGYHFIGFDELTHFEEEPYEFIGFSRQRRPPDGPLAKVPMRVRATANPGGPGHIWVKRRFITHRDPKVIFVPAKLWDNPGIDHDDYVARLGKMKPALVKQLLDGDWEAFEGAAFAIEPFHLIDPVELHPQLTRFESMDYGISNPTCWLAWAVGWQGELIVFDEWYRPALPSESVPEIIRKRREWLTTVCYGDPASLAERTGTLRKWGEPATISTEFEDLGLPIVKANNDPRAGYTRLRELLKPDENRRFPDTHPRRGEFGSPRMFIVADRCPHLVEQLRAAPLMPLEKRWAGEMIDPEWEGRHGHATAAARYGAMSRATPGREPDPWESVPAQLRPQWTDADSMRAELLEQTRQRWERGDKQRRRTERV